MMFKNGISVVLDEMAVNQFLLRSPELGHYMHELAQEQNPQIDKGDIKLEHGKRRDFVSDGLSKEERTRKTTEAMLQSPDAKVRQIGHRRRYYEDK